MRPYREIMAQIKGVCEGETDLIANLSNTAAILKTLEGFYWVGFYLVKKEQLILGPFQGPVACTRIGWGKGVCGTAWKEKRSLMVPDVSEFPGHIACNEHSRSEVVVPIFDNSGQVWMVLDIDSDLPNHFTAEDLIALEAVARYISSFQTATT